MTDEFLQDEIKRLNEQIRGYKSANQRLMLLNQDKANRLRMVEIRMKKIIRMANNILEKPYSMGDKS